MRRTFSIATLLLVMALAAIAMASIRTVVVEVFEGRPKSVLIPLAAGALGGILVGFFAAVWNVGASAIWRPGTWPGIVGATVGGCVLGAGAGAQTTVAVDWTVIVLMPLVILSCTALLAVNRRRKERLREASAASSPHAEPRAAASLGEPR